MTPPVPDGPDTALADAIAYFDEFDPRVALTPRYLVHDALLHAATIVRAYLDRPAVARTDGQPPADDTGWTSVCDELHLDADAPASAVVDRLRLLKSRYEQLSEAAGHEVLVDGLTAEQYRHIYADLIHGLAVDLGLDPEKAGGGSVTAAVRRLVAAQNSHGGDQ